MDLDDELYGTIGTHRAQNNQNIREGTKPDFDDLDYGMELGDGEGSSEDDNYYYGVSMTRGTQHKQLKSVD